MPGRIRTTDVLTALKGQMDAGPIGRILACMLRSTGRPVIYVRPAAGSVIARTNPRRGKP